MEKRLTEIKARAEAATPGPWIDDGNSTNPTDDYWAECYPRDAEFIAHSREDVPWLIEQINRLRGALDQLGFPDGKCAHGIDLELECDDCFREMEWSGAE